MATKAELERDIRNVKSLISEAEKAAAQARGQATATRDQAAKQRLLDSAKRRESDVVTLNNRLRGLESHLRGLR